MQDSKADTNRVRQETIALRGPRTWQLRLKRMVDVLGSGFALLVLAPILAMIACAIWCFDGLPILYQWRVVGKGGVPFTSWKFRTMVPNADQQKRALRDLNEMQGPVFKMRHDPRITSLGHTLRRLSLDELPQFWSVLIGDMSLVGPRPPLFEEYQKFTEWQKQKLSVTPGMTCLWQVNGRSSVKDFDQWVGMDLQYIEEWSLWGDFKIMLRTVLVVLSRRGAY